MGDEDGDFDPIGECIHCGADVGYSEWEEHPYNDGIVCPHCDGPQAVDDVYPGV